MKGRIHRESLYHILSLHKRLILRLFLKFNILNQDVDTQQNVERKVSMHSLFKCNKLRTQIEGTAKCGGRVICAYQEIGSLVQCWA